MDNELEDLKRILDWALHRASNHTKAWMEPAADRIAKELWEK